MAGFLACYFLPVGVPRFDNALGEALLLVKWYTREHVLLCLVPAFFIAGAIAVFISQASVMKYLGGGASKILAYSVASVSGTTLAVCSCTVLPLFAGIYKMGAGLGPATTFLYSGPAINALAIILTARVLGLEMGIARAVGAVVFSIVIGLLMQFFFRKEETEKARAAAALPAPETVRPLWQNAFYFALMIAVLVFANWGSTGEGPGFFHFIHSMKWILTAVSAAALAAVVVLWFRALWWKVLLAAAAAVAAAFIFPDRPVIAFTIGILGLAVITATAGGEMKEWFGQSWWFAKQILPLLLLGVLAAGLLLGRPGHVGLIPNEWIAAAVGGNSLQANFLASIVGAFMYFATLTEVPILEGLMASGMGKGPALALLLAGPALSLPNMLVIRSVLGTKKTAVFIVLVVIMATLSGMIYGTFFKGLAQK